DEEHLNAFLAAIASNSTINEELKEVLKKDFETLVESKVYIPDSFAFKRYTTDGICSRLMSTDFSDYDETNYTEVLAYILFNNNDIVASSLACELDECANNRQASIQSILFGSLYTEDKDGLLNAIFNHGTSEFAKDLAEVYNVDKKEITSLLKLINDYNNAKTDEERKSIESSFYAKLAPIMSNYYHNNNIKEIDKFILASQVYNGNFKYINNLFSDTLTITYEDPDYGVYNLYYDTQTGTDISQAVYFEKLVRLIQEKGNNLDYNDPDSRFLLYLTITACEDKLYYYTNEVTNCLTPRDLAQEIMARVFSIDDGFTNINPQVLYAYFSTGKINIK
ncbi:MAG: hypothetical protein K2I70_05715, partial [Bacilli bacterium]|nr:hypothetical protein [Bacilli bacterium]